MRYGASFPCCCCQTLKFKCKVDKVAEVERLRTEEGREAYLDTDLLNSTGKLFLMLDTVWICKDCRKSVEEGKRPTNSAMNGLGPTWHNLPVPLVNLSIEELDTIAFTQIFSVVHGLSAEDTGTTQLNKIA